MVFQHIENLKQRYTDKYVVVDESRPELRRFRGYTGVVKTVNMSGRALVQFEDFENNIGWFDIDVDFLRVIDAPPPKQEKAARHAPAKPTPTDKPTPAAPKAAPESGRSPGAGMSVQDILAAARGGQASGAASKEAPAKKEAKPSASAGSMSVADILAAARGEKAGGAQPAPAKTETKAAAPTAAQPSEATSAVKMETPQAKDPSQMSVAEILAAARGKAAAPAAPAPPPPAEAAPQPETVEEAVEEPAEEPAPTPAAQPPAGPLPTTTAEIIAWCRQRDSK